MLKIHRSDDASALVGALAGVLSNVPPDPLTPEIVSVPTRGIERWIAQQLALRCGPHGIAANISYPSPRRLVAQTLVAAHGGEHPGDPWRPTRLVWPVLEAIDATLDEPSMAIVSRFIRPNGTPIAGRRMEAALRIAELFSGYDLHQPELIREWAGGADVGPSGDPIEEMWAWQPTLWRQVRDLVGAPSLAEALPAIITDLQHEAIDLPFPDRLCIYGLTALPVGHLQVIAALAHHRDVHLFLLHPSPALWNDVANTIPLAPVLPLRSADAGDGLANHPILASWGRDSRELQQVLAAAGIEDSEHHSIGRPDAATLLGSLQADIRDNRRPAGPPGPGETDRRIAMAPDDHSIQVHSCHGPTRQAQVLRDSILHLLDADETLEPRDIVVMCPDVEAYAPLLEAAFRSDRLHRGEGSTRGPSTPAAGIPDIRIRVADRSPSRANPLAALAAEILAMAASRATAGSLLDFISLPAVCRRFGFDDDLLLAINDLIDDINISWGFDEEHRERLGLPGRAERTWEEALERLLGGIMVADRDIETIGARLPTEGVEGEDLHWVGKLVEVIARVAEVTHSMSTSMPASAWRQKITEAVAALGDTEFGHDWQWAALERELERRLGDDSVSGPELSLADVARLLSPLGRTRPSRTDHRTGDLTVCTLVPMRSVPHRVICLLGMDDGVFPRSLGADGDDLLTVEPRIGTPDPASEDRQLLLDALMAAGDHLVITYSGRDEHTNARKPPCVPVAELLDVIDQTAVSPTGGDVPASQIVVIEHPLQPFDARNFTPGALIDGGPWGFDHTMLQGAGALQAPQSPKPVPISSPLPPDRGDVDVADLCLFLEHPVRAFVNKAMGFRYPDLPERRDDNLPVELDGLAQWGIGRRFLAGSLRGHSRDDVIRAEHGRGTLPPGNLSLGTIEKISATVDEILSAVSAAGITIPARDSRHIDLAIDGGRHLSGTITNIADHRLVSVEYSRVAPKHITRAYARLLALTAAEPSEPWQVVLIGRPPGTGDGAHTEVLGPLGDTPEDRAARARDNLMVLIDLYDRGMAAPIPLFAATSHAFATDSNRSRGLREARKAWEDSYSWTREAHDRHHQLVFGDELPFDDLLAEPPRPDEKPPDWPEAQSRFEAMALRLWLPILEAGSEAE